MEMLNKIVQEKGNNNNSNFKNNLCNRIKITNNIWIYKFKKNRILNNDK